VRKIRSASQRSMPENPIQWPCHSYDTFTLPRCRHLLPNWPACAIANTISSRANERTRHLASSQHPPQAVRTRRAVGSSRRAGLLSLDQSCQCDSRVRPGPALQILSPDPGGRICGCRLIATIPAVKTDAYFSRRVSLPDTPPPTGFAIHEHWLSLAACGRGRSKNGCRFASRNVAGSSHQAAVAPLDRVPRSAQIEARADISSES
jgi:hypothetical protein